MPTLLERVDGDWCIGSWEPITWYPLEAWTPGMALRLVADDEPEPAHSEASIIGIEFPAFNDGRPLSLSVLLRTRMGYTGEIRAVGAVHEDLLHYMIRCGFSSMELADDRDPELALQLLHPYSQHYQGSITEPEPLYRRASRGG